MENERVTERRKKDARRKKEKYNSRTADERQRDSERWKARGESRNEADRKKIADRAKARRASQTDASREQNLHCRRVEAREKYKRLSKEDRKMIYARKKAQRAPGIKDYRERDAAQKKARRELWTEADLDKERRRRRKWRAKQRAKKMQTDKVRNYEQTSRPTRTCRHVSTTTPCLAETWTSCPSEAKCKACRQKLKPLRDNQILIKASTIQGRGLFLRTKKQIEKETVIMLVTGKRFEKHPNNATQFTIEVGEKYLEPDAPAKFVNHSDQPNSRFQKWVSISGDKEREEVAIVSIKRIQPNEEITVKYSDSHKY